MGFAWDDKRLRRAGLDYQSLPPLRVIMTIARFSKQKIPASVCPHHERYACSQRRKLSDGDYLMFGPETRGLPASILEPCPLNKKFAFQWCRTVAA